MREELKGKLILIVGPSGSGKGTIIKELKKRHPAFIYPASYTTREPRKGEINGEVYSFIKKEDFEKMIKQDKFLEYAFVHNLYYYGTAKNEIIEALKKGKTVIREVDIQGFESIKKLLPKNNLVSIFIKVDEEEDLRKRILLRGKLPEKEIQKRMKSMQNEIVKAEKCDYKVKNIWGKLEDSVNKVEKIILVENKN